MSRHANPPYNPPWNRRGDDNYRPPQSDFTFQATAGQGHAQPSFPDSTHHLPRRPPTARKDERPSQSQPRRPRDHGNGGRADRGRNNRGRNNRGGRGAPYSRPLVSDRPLLKINREPTPELLNGMDTSKSQYNNVHDTSDSEDASMDLESTSDHGGQPVRKKLRMDNQAEKNAVPTWSNAEIYTARPPPDESEGKRKDVMKMIRKAKATAGDLTVSRPVSDDFVAFDLGDSLEASASSDDGSVVLVSETMPKPSHTRFSHLDNLHPNRNLPPLVADSGRSYPVYEVEDSPTPPPLPPALCDSRAVDTWPPPPPPSAPPASRKEPAGKRGRKRNADEYEEDRIWAACPIAPSWRSRTPGNTTPWYRAPTDGRRNVHDLLNEEAADFFDFLRPLQFEEEIRQQLVDTVEHHIAQIVPGATVECFGSFAAGIYLPTSDMDLVAYSSQFRAGGHATLCQAGNPGKSIFTFGKGLSRRGLMKPGSMTVIPKAKVPLVKYVDQRTGLRIDISFENPTGVDALKTYKAWKTAFPAMPALVTLVKQYLLMREINEVHTGGIGGFSVTCLVVSFLQHMHTMPFYQEGKLLGRDPTQHLGYLLLHIFNFYGNIFNLDRDAIQFNPPMIFNKSRDARFQRKDKTQRLTIVDPNRPDNDISVGSNQAARIFKAFSEAAADLKRTMRDIETGRTRPVSLLACLYSGDYARCYQAQRDRMWALTG